MNDSGAPQERPDPAEEPSGANLKLAYSLLAGALLAAICIALFIVLPFYHRR